jgi:hypothetical protein
MGIAVHPTSWLERRRARRTADYWIKHGFESRYAWRVTELTRERERRLCARALRGVIGELEGSSLPGAAPLRRAALRPHLATLQTLRERLLDNEPVSGVGMLAVNELLTSPGSCLYTECADVGSSLDAVLESLDAD